MDGLREAFDEIDRLRNSGEYQHHTATPQDSGGDGQGHSDVNFEDLGRKDV